MFISGVSNRKCMYQIFRVVSDWLNMCAWDNTNRERGPKTQVSQNVRTFSSAYSPQCTDLSTFLLRALHWEAHSFPIWNQETHCPTWRLQIRLFGDCWRSNWQQDILLFLEHDDVIKWKHFPRYWPFVRGIHRSPVNSPHKGQWCGALMLFWSAPE